MFLGSLDIHRVIDTHVTRSIDSVTTWTGAFQACSKITPSFPLLYYWVIYSTCTVLEDIQNKGLEDRRFLAYWRVGGRVLEVYDRLLLPFLETRRHKVSFRQNRYGGDAGPKRPITHKFGDHDETIRFHWT